jgi:methyl-accepting chemotaxis protein
MSQSDNGVPVLTPVTDALERVVFAPWYRWFVRGLLVAAALVVLVHLIRATTDALALSASGTRMLSQLTSVVVTLFVLAGALQLLLVARGVRRREETVAESAAEVEQSADEVKSAAEELEETVERSVEEGSAPEETARELTERAKHVEEQADEVKETVEGVKEGLHEPEEKDETF